jgi:ribosomal protein L11 methyltransferase
MNHIQLSIEAAEEEQESLIALLSELDATGFEQTDSHLVAYFEEVRFPSYDVHEVLKKFRHQANTIKEQNWNAEWEAGFQPVVVDAFCAVRAHFHPPVPGVAHEIIITPKMSFGTGHHATTFLMLQAMQHIDFTNRRVLDFGTGTGILAILAEKRGASQVTAIDNDAWSFENVLENIQLNACTRIKALHTDAIPSQEPFHVILANITKNVLLDYMPVLKSSLVPAGILVCSGILTEDKQDMCAAGENWGMKLVRESERENWVSLLFVN